MKRLHLRLPKLKLKKRGKKLRATTARRPIRASVADYDEMAEPNMKLSRALLIVLILHVVAVSGIIAFNAIKTRQGVTSTAATPPAPAVATSGPKAPSAPSTSPSGGSSQPEIRRAHAISKPAEDGHKTYTVQKGDKPVTIAKKLKVPYDDLLALNHIDDPRKLKVGQKLLVPNKSKQGKKSEE